FLGHAAALCAGGHRHIIAVEAQTNFSGWLEAHPLPAHDVNARVGPGDIGGYDHALRPPRRIRAAIVFIWRLIPLVATLVAPLASGLREHVRCAEREYSRHHGNEEWCAHRNPPADVSTVQSRRHYLSGKSSGYFKEWRPAPPVRPKPPVIMDTYAANGSRQRIERGGAGSAHGAAGLGLVLVQSRIQGRGDGAHRRFALGRAHEFQG